MTFEHLETREVAAMEIVGFRGALPQRHPSDTIGSVHNRVPRFRFSAMALGSAQANETVNYPGKLSGNSLISGSCLPPDGIPQVAEHLAPSPLLLLYAHPL